MKQKFLIISLSVFSTLAGLLFAYRVLPAQAYFKEWRAVVLSATTSQLRLEIGQFVFSGSKYELVESLSWEEIYPGDLKIVGFDLKPSSKAWICGQNLFTGSTELLKSVSSLIWLDVDQDGRWQEAELILVDQFRLDEPVQKLSFAVQDSSNFVAQVLCFGALHVESGHFGCQISPERDYNLISLERLTLDWEFEATQKQNNSEFKCE